MGCARIRKFFCTCVICKWNDTSLYMDLCVCMCILVYSAGADATLEERCPGRCFSQEKTIEAFFQEYNCDCENYSGEDLYEFFGFDYEDDVTPALEAINLFCKNCSEPNKN